MSEDKRFDIAVIKQRCPAHNNVHYRIDVASEDVEKFEKWFGISPSYSEQIEEEGKNYKSVCSHIKKKITQ